MEDDFMKIYQDTAAKRAAVNDMTPQKQGIHNQLTANSTPEKTEVDQFTTILEPLDRRVLKT